MEWQNVQCDQIWRNFATLAKNWNSLSTVTGLIYYLAHFWAYFDKWIHAFGYIFIVVNGLILKINLPIWSHWKRCAIPFVRAIQFLPNIVFPFKELLVTTHSWNQARPITPTTTTTFSVRIRCSFGQWMMAAVVMMEGKLLAWLKSGN